MKKSISQWRILGLAFAAAGILSLVSGPLASATVTREIIASDVTDSVRISFPVGSAVLDEGFGDNAEAFRALNRILHPDTGLMFVLRRVSFIGGSSPEGGEAVNRDLSEKRADAVYAYFLKHYKEFSSVPTTYSFVGRDWKGLLALVEADPAVPFRNESVALLGQIAATYNVDAGDRAGDEAMARFRQLRDGAPYVYMNEHLFPKLRSTNVYVTYDLVKVTEAPEPEPVAEPEPVPVAAPEPEPVAVPAAEPEPVATPAVPERRSFYMDISTNMLYDLAMTPNIGVEFYLGGGWSVAADWQYSWWSNKEHDFCWRNYGGDLTVRKWLGKKSKEKPLQGHHLGVYGQIVSFDYQLGHIGHVSGTYVYTDEGRNKIGNNKDKPWNWGVGVEYGYSLPVTRRLNMDFSIGVGYAGGTTNSYEWKDDEYFTPRKTRKVHYVGPTRAEISLVWLIGHDNCNANKGHKSK